MSTAPVLTLGDQPLQLDALRRWRRRPLQVSVSAPAWQRIDAARAQVDAAVASGRVHYGINTGFGHLKSVTIPREQLALLQENLILSHAVGTGADAPAQVVRWMTLFKIQGLLAGHSGVHRDTVALLVDLLNADCLAVVPSRGSVGASGDLAPLAHLTLPLLGRGEVTLDGRRMAAAAALQQLQRTAVQLGPKEGLALINGTQYMSAVGAEVLLRAESLVRQADLIGSMSLEALQGSATPFDERLHAVRPHRGAITAAANLRRLLAGSEILPAHAGCSKVQDPYSLRCMPPVHGASRDAVAHARAVIETEINSVTDNPILFGNGDILSGGNFHGQPLALVLEYLGLALAELASISERRTYLLLSGADGLPPMLIRDAGLNTGLMILQYTAAALVNENKMLVWPAAADTIPTSMGQEDHVSMGATSANKLLALVENCTTVLAIEALCAGQGLDFRAPLQAGLGPRLAHAALRGAVAHASADRAFGDDLQTVIRLVTDDTLLDAVQNHVDLE